MDLLHWYYSFCVHTCHLGDRVRNATNPFTGDLLQIPIDEGLTIAECRAIRELFVQNGVEGPEPEHEGYALYLSVDEHIRFRGGSLEFEAPGYRRAMGFAVEIIVKQLSDHVLDFVLSFARRGNLAFISSTGQDVGLTAASHDPKIISRWPNARILDTVDKLRSWIEDTIGGRKVHVPRNP